MPWARRIGLVSTIALSLAAATQPASAQTRSAEEAGAAADTARADEVVVIARKREERLDDVPSSITVFDAQYLEDLSVGSGKDLTRLTPGLYVIDNGSGFNDEFLIRGEGAARQNNAETGSGLYRNGVFIAGGNAGGRNFVPIDFFDVGDIVVLRGPQGSFYGRNALGGAVNITSRRPTDAFEAEAELVYGVNDFLAAEAIVNVPLSETLQVRLGVGATSQTDGFYRSTITQQILDKEDSHYWRMQFAWRPTPNLDLNLLWERAEEFGPNQAVFGQVLAVNDPPINPVGAPTGYSVARFAKAMDTPSWFDRTTEMLVLEGRLNLGWASLQLTSAARLRDARNQTDVDLYGNNKVARLTPSVAQGAESFDRTAHDLRLVSQGGGRLDWLVGVERTDVSSVFSTIRFPDALKTNVFSGPAGVPAVLPADCLVAPTCTLAQVQTTARNGYRTENSGVDDRSTAAYAALGWQVTDTLKLSADVRYSNDQKGFRLANVLRLDNPATPANEQLTRSVVADETFTKWTPSLSANWRAAPGLTAYARIGTGYRAGGYNNDLGEIGDGVSAAAIPLVYDAEFVVAYEAGVRGRLGRSVRYELNAYRNEKQDTLVNYAVFAGTTATNTVRNIGVLNNVGDSYQQGFDGELAGRFSLMGGVLSARASFSWADGAYEGGAVFGNQQTNPATTLALVSIDGRRIQRLREWTTAASMIWRATLVSGVDIYASISQRGERGGFEDPQNTNLMDDVMLFDAGLGIETPRWRLVLSGKNVFDVSYYTIPPGNQSFNTQENEPATWRLTFGVTL